MRNIAVFASGRGTNFQAIAQNVKSSKIKANLALLVCDNPGAGVLRKARKFAVKVALIRRQEYADRTSFEREIIAALKTNKIDLIVLAGFMRMLGPDLIRSYRNKIINIHPSLLPAFKGSNAIEDAFRYGVKFTGVTVHFVDEKMDHGPIIVQEVTPIYKRDTLASLEARIHRIEHKLYTEAINLFLGGCLKTRARKVIAI